MSTKLFIVFLIVCTVAHIIRAVYEILKHLKKIRATKISFIIMFIIMALLWASWFGMCEQDAFKIHVPLLLKYFGLFLAIAGVVIFITALFTIKALESYDGDLITHGIYSKIRHPMYLSFILWLIGLPVFYGSGFSFIAGIFFMINVLFWRHLEEIELLKRFGGYKEYKRNTIF